jgi:hypothetical protein
MHSPLFVGHRVSTMFQLTPIDARQLHQVLELTGQKPHKNSLYYHSAQAKLIISLQLHIKDLMSIVFGCSNY